jgi:hypothetical protein
LSFIQLTIINHTQQIEDLTITIEFIIFHWQIDQSICDATQGLVIPAVDKVSQLQSSLPR